MVEERQESLEEETLIQGIMERARMGRYKLM